MKRVGDLLRPARSGKGLSYKDLEELTHIRTSFIEALEKSQWQKLPEYNITLGFVKSISHFLDVDELEAVSIFRREYPVKQVQSLKLKVQNDRNLNRKFAWGPRLTFLTGVVVIVIIILAYLGFQYGKFNSPPTLIIDSPVEDQVVISRNFVVKGKTDPDATVIVNNQSVIPDADGNFSASIEVSENTNEVTITVTNRAGKVTSLSRRITVTQ